MKQFTPRQVLDHIDQTDAKPVLLDVREPHEYEICAISGSINIPLAQIPSSLGRLDPEAEYVLICHHGMRSHRAGDFLAEQGFDKLINLLGGIDAWACDIDSNMQRY